MSTHDENFRTIRNNIVREPRLIKFLREFADLSRTALHIRAEISRRGSAHPELACLARAAFGLDGAGAIANLPDQTDGYSVEDCLSLAQAELRTAEAKLSRQLEDAVASSENTIRILAARKQVLKALECLQSPVHS
jgi:hypothetical protein